VKSSKILLLIMIIVIIIIIIIITGILIRNNKNKINNDEILEIQDENVEGVQNKDEVFNEINKMSNIDDHSEYFNVKKILELYVENFKESKYENIISMYSNDVIEKLNINKDNIKEKINIPAGIVRIDDLMVSYQTDDYQGNLYTTDIRLYYVNADILDLENMKKSNIKSLILLDYINGTFYIIPQEYYKSNNLNPQLGSNLEVYKNNKIEENEYNKIALDDIEDEDIVKEYFNIFKTNVMYDFQSAYDSLDEEYRKKRFERIDNFTNFIQISNLKNRGLKKYQSLINDNNIREYICLDQYENYYIFSEDKGIMNMATVKLDTYTIISDKYKKAYDEGDNQLRVQLSLDKFTKMINNKDYDSAYNVINETFREAKLKSKENFINLVKSKMFEYNSIEFKEIEEKNGITRCKVNFKDLNDESNKNVFTWEFIVKLNENYNFELSFNLQ